MIMSRGGVNGGMRQFLSDFRRDMTKDEELVKHFAFVSWCIGEAKFWRRLAFIAFGVQAFGAIIDLIRLFTK